MNLPTPNPSPVRVLVIDEDDNARVEMMQRLHAAGQIVMGLASPIGATKVVLGQSIDVVVITLEMPSLRGDKLAGVLRKNPRLQSLGVVMVSSGNPRELARLREELPGVKVLDKDHLDQELALAVRAAILGSRRPFSPSIRARRIV